MSYQYVELSGSIDNITQEGTTPTPAADELWAEILLDGSGNPSSYKLYASDGNNWYHIETSNSTGTELLVGGVDYFQTDPPSSSKEGEIWVPKELIKNIDPPKTQSTTEGWNKSDNTGIGSAAYVSNNSSNGEMLIYAANGKVEAIDPNDPTTSYWTFNNLGSPNKDMDISSDESNMVVTDNGTVYYLNVDNGNEQWNASTSGDYRNTATMQNGSIYTGGEGDPVPFYKYDSSGNRQWSVTHDIAYDFSEGEHASVNPSGDAVWYLSTRAFSRSPAIAKIDTSDGSLINSYNKLTNRPLKLRVPKDNVLYIGLDIGYIRRLSLGGGVSNWTHTQDDGLENISRTKNGVIYGITQTNSNVYAVDKETGNQLWESGSNSTEDVGNFVVDGYDSVYASDRFGNLFELNLDPVVTDINAGDPLVNYNGYWGD